MVDPSRILELSERRLASRKLRIVEEFQPEQIILFGS